MRDAFREAAESCDIGGKLPRYVLRRTSIESDLTPNHRFLQIAAHRRLHDVVLQTDRQGC